MWVWVRMLASALSLIKFCWIAKVPGKTLLRNKHIEKKDDHIGNRLLLYCKTNLKYRIL